MKKVKKWVYVTYQFKPTDFCRALGYKTEYYAVRCTEENYLEVAMDVNSLDGASYLRINKCGRIRKDAKILEHGEYMKHYMNR